MIYTALIYSHSISPRLKYIVDFLSHYYKLNFKLTSDEDSYINADSTICKLNYSYHRIHVDEIWIHPHVLLFESAVHPVKIECFEHHTYKAFFKTEGDIPFDLFAAIFYLISRYEEYLPHKKDVYGRYAHTNALAFQQNFLHLPLINIWLEDFRTTLQKKNSAFYIDNEHAKKAFSFLPTYDIDMAWSYRNKGFTRNAGSLLKFFFTGKWKRLSYRIQVLRSKKQDPFDAYSWMDDLHTQYKLNPIYFFLVALQKGKHDKNIRVDNLEFQQLVKRTASRYEIALHPSWASGDIPQLLSKEKKKLEQLTEQPVHTSRQHFIRFNLPDTYIRLLQAGLKNDFSMGYGSINGFRASITTPFFWYDLKNDEPTQLLIHPFCFMDANAYYEQKQTTEVTLQEMMHYYHIIKSVNGTMITIWHNSFLGTTPGFEGWRELYQQFVKSVESEISA